MSAFNRSESQVDNSKGRQQQGKKRKKPSGVVGEEIQVQKSPAEFFAENQSIAGFDNLGKSLYTSIRELVENALDACETIGQLPDVSIEVTEYTEEQFNRLCHIYTNAPNCNDEDDLDAVARKDESLNAHSNAKRPKHKLEPGTDEKKEAPPVKDDANTSNTAGQKPKKGSKSSKKGTESAVKIQRRNDEGYFRVRVRDNGCGMQHDAIPNLFGRVLSGSKYGVRQTRGKFGLGAKMALIWSKKSTGQPIRITTAHRPPDHGLDPPTHKSTCVLDINIYKNEPRVLEHKREKNKDNFVGTEVEILIAGNWTTYKARILQYLQQLAIITPYAAFQMSYSHASDAKVKRSVRIRYDRRSDQMPPPAKTVKHHPSSVNNLVIQQLIQFTRCKTLIKFLSTELSGVSATSAKRLLAEESSSGAGLTEEMDPSSLTDAQITRLVQLLRQGQFKAPDGSCLSPLGEYNLSLGIRKVLDPALVATARDKPGAYEGHPFLVEAAVSLGGTEVVKEGITVIRFGNRIPLLFEGGADVTTRVANTKIHWANYKIDQKKDKVGVFVSIVSTKIPFKGTSKEYIGDDATEIQQSVKRAIQACCQQLRAHLTKRNAMKEASERKSRLVKYIPDVTRSLVGLLDGVRRRRLASTSGGAGAPETARAAKRKSLQLDAAAVDAMIQQMNAGQVTDNLIEQALQTAIDQYLPSAGDGGCQGTSAKSKAAGLGASMRGKESSTERPVPIFLIPLYNMSDSRHDIRGGSFTFRPIKPVEEFFQKA